MSHNMAVKQQGGPTRPRGFLAGVGAALAMTAVMGVLRYTTGTPSLPELLGEAIVGLMPATVFSFILDAMQKAAKPTLYAGIFVGMLAVGGLLGRGFAFGELTWSRALRLAAVIWAAFGLVIFPLLGVGLFGGNGLRTGLVALAIQHAIVLVSFTGTLLLLLRAGEPEIAAPVRSARRRTAVVGLLGGLVAVALGGTAWKMLLGSSPTSSLGASPTAPSEGTASSATGAGQGTAPAGSTAQSGAAASSGAPSAAATTEAGAAAPPAATAAPVAVSGPRPVPSIDAPSVAMTVQPNQANPAPFDLSGLSHEVFTAKDFYTVSKNLIDPTVDVNGWSLKIDGLVVTPTSYVYADLTKLPTYSNYYTLQCISNEVGGDLWGNAHWKGVRLVELLSRAGLKAGVRKVVFYAEDGYTDSIPLDAALRPDTLVAFEMNGEPLAKEHGAPARLLIPGIYGMKNVKWVTRIELVDYDFKGYWMQRGWSDDARYNTETRIDVPATRAQVGAGEVALGGVTFAGFRGIDKVEISLDNGQSWEPAQLKPALSQNAWNLWIFRKQLGPGTYQVRARAVDGNGDVQTDLEADPVPSGATGYHSIVLRVG